LLSLKQLEEHGCNIMLLIEGYKSMLRFNCPIRISRSEFQGGGVTLREWITKEEDLEEVRQYRIFSLRKLMIYAQKPEHAEFIFNLLCEQLLDIVENNLMNELSFLLESTEETLRGRWCADCLTQIGEKSSHYQTICNFFMKYQVSTAAQVPTQIATLMTSIPGATFPAVINTNTSDSVGSKRSHSKIDSKKEYPVKRPHIENTPSLLSE
jgi:hypothetical protein